MNPDTMSLIQEAIQRRATGPLGGGTTMPATDQMTPPTGETPTGGANVPSVAPQAPPMPPQGDPRALLARKAMGLSSRGQAAQFDDETRQASKTLMTQLLKYI